MPTFPNESKAVGHNAIRNGLSFVDRQAEWHRHNNIFESAERIGADYIEACGELPTKEVMAVLQQEAYIDYGPQEILEVFHDWEDFQNFARQKHDQRIDEKQQLASEIRRQISEGQLPFIFAAEYKNKDGNPWLTGKLVAETELIRRYARYTVAGEFITNEPDTEQLDSRVAIALAIDPQTHGFSSGSFARLVASSSETNQRDVGGSRSYREWYYSLFPSKRAEHLRRLMGSASLAIPTNEFDFYYDRSSRIISMVGKSAFVAALISSNPYLNWLKQKKKLSSRSEMPADTEFNENVLPLADLVVADCIQDFQVERTEKREVKPGRDIYLSYGRFISQLVRLKQPTPRYSNRFLRNAYEMGFGFSPYQIASEFGSVANMWREIGVSNFKHDNEFSAFGLEDFGQAFFQLGQKLGRKPTRGDIVAESKINPGFPSYHAIRGCGLTLGEIYSEAGWPDIQRWGTEDYEDFGVRYMLANYGLVPSQRPLNYLSKQKKGPAHSTFRHGYPYSFAIYKTRVIMKHRRLIEQTGRKELEDIVNSEQVMALRLPDEMIARIRKYGAKI